MNRMMNKKATNQDPKLQHLGLTGTKRLKPRRNGSRPNTHRTLPAMPIRRWLDLRASARQLQLWAKWTRSPISKIKFLTSKYNKPSKSLNPCSRPTKVNNNKVQIIKVQCLSNQSSSSSSRSNNCSRCNNWTSWKNQFLVWNTYMASAWMGARNACSFTQSRIQPLMKLMLQYQHSRLQLQILKQEVLVRTGRDHLNTNRMSVCPKSIWTRSRTILMTHRSQTWTWYKHWWSKCLGSSAVVHLQVRPRLDHNTTEALMHLTFRAF